MLGMRLITARARHSGVTFLHSADVARLVIHSYVNQNHFVIFVKLNIKIKTIFVEQ